MLTIFKQNEDIVKERIQLKLLDNIVGSYSNIIDSIILSMHNKGILNCFSKWTQDNDFYLNLLLLQEIVVKMRPKTSSVIFPYAIRDHRLLSALGYNLSTFPNKKLMFESNRENFISDLGISDITNHYNNLVQNNILKNMDICPHVHILCYKKINFEFENTNHETDYNKKLKNEYQMISLRGIYGNSYITEEVHFVSISALDLIQSENIIKNCSCVNEGDILVITEEFLSSSCIRYLKEDRKVEIYISLKKDMLEYEYAINLAEELDDWKIHPTIRNQMICQISLVDFGWIDTTADDFIELNACVIWQQDTDGYFVFTTTDMNKSAEEIILIHQTYLKTEENYDAFKNYWNLVNFKYNKSNAIAFHIICMFSGHLFYQIFLNIEDDKKYTEEFLEYLVLYSGEYYCSMTIGEFIKYRDGCNEEIKEFLLKFIK